MDALNALRSLAYPALRTEPPAKTATDTTLGTARPIPFSELEKLSPNFAPQPFEGARPAGASFDSMLGGIAGQVVEKQAAAGQSVNGLLAGGNVSLHQTMIAMEEASVSFQLMVEVRNKLLESYQELMRMQV